ncbi:hypothetical protein Pla52o_25420 [Novipirellula galeiformis]|uniref:Uncharacterized protein n=1 Tax=Novipirellula galeiformis TaxID=2528004 RepID=A0A5C6CFE0_9BACT|nr:hypothetical protein Pla52o_25420 [Novipirellula galeiformis]
MHQSEAAFIFGGQDAIAIFSELPPDRGRMHSPKTCYLFLRLLRRDGAWRSS